ncbi:hypothetical protein [Arthrobacter castelli]|uniref:hypothetical protein n=1 Tax=Arthrobacter castelli TaxID=271431 RepID=UPI0004134CBD|nr:hypothetical protein [Arthrobacter castelli]
MTETRTDKKWLDNFALELRLHNVSGQDVGDALAHVESYCADSGETPVEAFGDPVEYAQRLELRPEESEGDLHRRLRYALPSLAGVIGLFVFLPAIRAAYRGGPVTINIWQIGFILLLAAIIIAAIANLGILVRNKWVLIAFAVAGPLCGVGFAISGTTAAGSPALVLPALPVVIAAAVVLVAAALWGHLRDRNEDRDPIIRPTDTSTTTAKNHRWSRILQILPHWLLVLAAAGTALFQYFLVT